METLSMNVIGHVQTDFETNFGLPRQSGLIDELEGLLVFEPEYRDEAAVRGLEGYSHLWILWVFDGYEGDAWSPTVRPPRLGGNARVGVFATRSPNRPNPIGLSCVEFREILYTEEGPKLRLGGIDVKNGTRVLDVKPYLPFADAHPEARGGFASEKKDYALKVVFDETAAAEDISPEERSLIVKLLAQDPRPAYQNDPERSYGFEPGNISLRFRVEGDTAHVTELHKTGEAND